MGHLKELLEGVPFFLSNSQLFTQYSHLFQAVIMDKKS
jgi:hypothetical protein